MITKYIMKILAKDYTKSFNLNVISVYQWDSTLGFNPNIAYDNYQTLDGFRKITNLMLGAGFLNQFYAIVDSHREFAKEYRYGVFNIIFDAQHNLHHIENEYKKPALVFLSDYQDSTGTMRPFEYINTDWNFNYVTKLINQDIQTASPMITTNDIDAINSLKSTDE